MTSDDATTGPGPDLEARLRDSLHATAGSASVPEADWGDLAGRIAHSTRHRQRLLAGAAGFALLVGGAGGYFGEAAASTGAPLASAPSTTTTTPAPRGAAAAAGPDIAGGAPCIGVAGPATGVQIGADTHVFTRTTDDGVTIRVYVEPAPTMSGCGPVAQGNASGQSGAASSTTVAPPTTTTVPPAGSGPVPVGSTVSIELSDDSAVGQGALSTSLCPASPVGSGSTGSGSTGLGSTGSGSTGTGTIAPEPAVPLTPAQTALPPASTDTTLPPGGTTTTTTTIPTTPTAPAASEPQDVSSGAFGVAEGGPVWWVAVRVGSEVASVKMAFADGSADQMVPVDGIAVLAHRIAPASAGSDPSTVSGTLELIGAGGATLATVTLPASAGPVPTPSPGSGGSGGSGSAGSGSPSSPATTTTTTVLPTNAPASVAGSPGSDVIVACPQNTATGP